MKAMRILQVILFLNLSSWTHSHFIDQGDHKVRDIHHGQSQARSKRASGNAVFENPWLKTDWNELGRRRIVESIENIEKIKNTKKAKNVILFIGDGMGLQTVGAARVFKGQKENLKGEAIYMSWERMPHTSLSRTYNVDRISPDSAGTGTAYMSGVKANYGTLGVNENVEYEKCRNVKGNEVNSILHKSIMEGKSTGIVTTTRVTHASPGASYCSTPSRNWESKVPAGEDPCVDIASQLIKEDRNQDIRVIFGGGAKMFLPNTEAADDRGGMGDREDGKNLIEEWKDMKKAKKATHRVLRSKDELDALNTAETDYVLGLFETSNMNYEMDRDPSKEPSLAEMTGKAIEVLRKNKEGYFLFVEGGRIDHAHHATLGQKALVDTLAFDKAITKALEMVDNEDTLVVVSADHSHTFSVSGYAKFSENILGYGDASQSGIKDNKPTLQMGYINGPGAYFHRFEKQGGVDVEKPRRDLADLGDQIYQKDFTQDAGVWTDSEHHGAEDVGIYATGPWSHLFQATEEQSYLAHVMMYASCVGQYAQERHCAKSGFNKISSNYYFLVLLLLIGLFVRKF